MLFVIRAAMRGGKETYMREKINFDAGWRFHKGDIKNEYPAYKGFSYLSAKTERYHIGPASEFYNDDPDCYNNNVLMVADKWENVDLPHDYLIDGVPDKQYNNALGFRKYENGWYRKRFSLGEEDRDRRLVLYFEGVATRATVYLNGCLMKHSFTGYTPFEVDITDMARFDKENVLAVYVDTEEHESWWYEGAGIYRHVWLFKTDLISIDRYGIYAKPQKIDDSKWRVDCEVTVRNDTVVDTGAAVKGRILDADGNEVAMAEGAAEILCKDKSVVKYSFEVSGPNLWSPDGAYLYTMEASVLVGGEVVDTDSVHFGFRTLRIDRDKGLFINDKHYKIKGFCGHAGCGLTGKAVPDNIERYKVELLREMGANGFRCSHYPYSDVFMDELDKAGFIVMDEVRWFESTEEGIDQLETLVRRDRNRPGVVFWSVGNEETYHCREQGRRICETLMAKLRRLDDSRFVMTAVDRPDGATVYDVNDVIGINYNLGSYEHAHEKFTDKAIFASECAAVGTTRGWYFPHDDIKGYNSAYDVERGYFGGREKTWKFIAERDWILGGYQWNAYEYRGEAVWPRQASQSGSIDLFLQRKDSFYQNMSHFTSEPMVHMLPHWNWRGFEGDVIDVWGYTNCEELELFLNGKSLGRKTIEKYGHGAWQVAFEPGEVVMKGYIGGVEVANDRHVTSGKAYRLVLTQDTLDVEANGADIAIFTCTVEDECGNPVPDAELPRVIFSTRGDCKVYSTGSDVSEHDTIFRSERRMRAGRIGIAVKLGNESEGMKLYAQANDLVGAVTEIKVK